MILEILIYIVTLIGGAYLEREHGITVTIEKSLETNTTSEYKDIIITDK